VVSYCERIDAIFGFSTTAFHDIVGVGKVSFESINCQRSFEMVSGDMIIGGSAITKDISPFPILTLECNVFWIKPSQERHYCTPSQKPPTKL
jgi:hypothetical protein